MDFRNWLKLNEIRTPPHMPQVYYKGKLEKIRSFESKLDGFPSFLENVTYFLYKFIGDNGLNFLNVPGPVAKLIDTTQSYEKLSYRIEWFMADNNRGPHDIKSDLERLKLNCQMDSCHRQNTPLVVNL